MQYSFTCLRIKKGKYIISLTIYTTDTKGIKLIVLASSTAALDFKILISLTPYLVYIDDPVFKEDRFLGIRLCYARTFYES